MGVPRRSERAALAARIVALEAVVVALQARVAEVEAENAVLRAAAGRPPDPPSFVKPKTASPPSEPRQPRDWGHGRPCVAVPDRVVTHALDGCPGCGAPLQGGWETSRHEVIDLPPVTAEVVQHVRLLRQCAACGRRSAPPPDPAVTGPGGHGRFGPRLTALVGYLQGRLRLPLRQIQDLLAQQYGLTVSVGALGRLLATVAAQGQAAVDEFRATLPAAPYVHVDETGWRENGQPGYLWTFVTPDTQLFLRDASRATRVAAEVLGAEYPGVIVADGYVAYSALPSQKQRCWVHLLRHGHELTTRYPDAAAAHCWVARVRALYDHARARVARPRFRALREDLRAQVRQTLEAAVLRLATPHRDASLPEWRNLARFLVAHVTELFVFVQFPDVPSHNNPAEQALRPLVIARKISGGTRSAEGTARRLTLCSLLQTAHVRGLAPLDTLLALLTGHPFPAPARASP